MELEDYQNLWHEHDKKLDSHIAVNLQHLKQLNLDKVQGDLDRFLRAPVYGLLIGILLLLLLTFFIVSHSASPQFVAPALLIGAFVLLQIISSVLQSSKVLKLGLDAPITQIQKQLQTLSMGRIRYLTITRFSYPLLWVPVLIVATKAIFNVDLYAYLEYWWIGLQIGIGVAFIGFGAWLSKQYVSQTISSGWLTKLMDNITRNDITGKNLRQAIAAAQHLEDFEKEA